MEDQTIPTPILCPQCHQPVPPGAYFCANCGKNLNEPPASTTVFTQTWIYLLSIFLPPLGLWPGIKYFKSSDPKTKRVGIIAITLTVLSTIITVWLTFALFNVYLSTITSLSNGNF